MRTASRWVLVTAVACAVAGAASAQENRRPGQRRPGGGEGGQPPGGVMRGGAGMMGGGGIMLLSNESVQKELKVTDEQKEKLKKFAEDLGPKMREKMQGVFQGGGGGGDREAMMAKAQEAMKKLNAEAMKELAEAKVLDDGQMKRFKQIQIQSQLQREGPGVFSAEEVQTSLKLTDDQKEKLKGLAGEMRKDMGELGRGFDAEAMQKRRAVTKEYTTKAMETLTDEQKSAWKDLTGAPFEVKFDVRAGGERRPGGEGGDTPRRRPGGENRPPRSDTPPPA